MKYRIIVENKGWFKKGFTPWITGKKHSDETKKHWSEIRKGKRQSPSTEFKYKNGRGYRHLIYKGLLPKWCDVCGEKDIKKLQIHHIDKDRTNNNIDNFKVLCWKHHLEIHGRKQRL